MRYDFSYHAARKGDETMAYLEDAYQICVEDCSDGRHSRERRRTYYLTLRDALIRELSAAGTSRLLNTYLANARSHPGARIYLLNYAALREAYRILVAGEKASECTMWVPHYREERRMLFSRRQEPLTWAEAERRESLLVRIDETFLGEMTSLQTVCRARRAAERKNGDDLASRMARTEDGLDAAGQAIADATEFLQSVYSDAQSFQQSRTQETMRPLASFYLTLWDALREEAPELADELLPRMEDAIRPLGLDVLYAAPGSPFDPSSHSPCLSPGEDVPPLPEVAQCVRPGVQLRQAGGAVLLEMARVTLREGMPEPYSTRPRKRRSAIYHFDQA